MKTRLLFFMLFFGLIITTQAQVSINQEGTDPHSSAMLDVSSNDKGLLIPRMSSVERQAIPDPANGLMVFDTNTNSFWFYSTSTNEWEEMGGAIVNALNDLLDAKTNSTSIYLGNNSGTSSTGNGNSALGYQSMKSNINGYANAAMGHQSMQDNINGHSNSAFGVWSLRKNNAESNTAIGAYSLSYNTNGSSNVAIGDHSLLSNLGSNNTAVGTGAGQGSSNDASGNVFIGYNAGMTESGSNKLYIENSSSPTPLIGGDFETDEVDINGSLNVIGNLKVTGGNPAEGKVLTSDEYGNASWSDAASGAQELNDLEDVHKSTYNLFMGEETGSTQGSSFFNIGIGDHAISSSDVSINNIAIGFHAGNNQSGSIGDSNIIIGNQAGIYINGGNQLIIENSSNTAPLIHGNFKEDHLKVNGTLEITGGEPAEGKVLVSDATGKASWEFASGANNIDELSDGKTNGNSVYLGTAAGIFEEEGTSSTGVGRQALLMNNGNNNNAFGFNAMNQNTSGTYNSAFGSYAIGNNVEGHYNVAVGNSTMNTLVNGDGNTAIGYRAGDNIGENVSGSVFIGKQAGTNETESNKLYIENSNSNTPLIGGDFETDEVVINGTLQITGGNPGAGKVLTSDANGNASWGNTTGVSGINDLSDAKNDYSSIYLGTSGGADDGNNKNTATGIFALSGNTSGQYNSAYGHKSLNANSEGSSNASFGFGTMELSTSGNENTALGNGALYNNGEGSQNTAVGFEAGFGNFGSNSTGNVFVGYKAGFYETSSNKLYIDNSDTYSPLIYGDFEQNKLKVNGEFLVTNASNNNLKINAQKLESNVLIDANASVEIAQTLDVDGEITANDKINAKEDIVLSDNKNIKYENVRTGKVHYGGSEFTWSTYESDSYGYYVYHEGTTLALNTQAYNNYTYFNVSKQIQLPDGVSLKNIKFHFGGGSEDYAEIKITKKSPTQTYSDTEKLFESTFNFIESGWTEYEFNLNNNSIIDNDYIYAIELRIKVNDNNNYGGTAALNVVTVEYEYDTLNH